MRPQSMRALCILTGAALLFDAEKCLHVGGIFWVILTAAQAAVCLALLLES